MAAPVRKGEELEVRIDSLAYGGNGVGRVDGFVVFVRGGLPGDLVRARATKVKRGFAEAIRTALLEPGPDRVEAPCRHFGTCGGCRFQDYAYARQLEAKEQQVRDALTRLGGFAEPPLEPIVPARSEYGYRNKLEYSFASGPDGLVLGFHRAGRWDEVIDVEECLLTTPVGNAIREAVKEWARDGGARAVRPGHADRVPPPPRRARGAEHGAGARRPRDRTGRALRRGLPDRDAHALPRGALDPLGDQRPAVRGDEPPDAPALGRRLDRGGAARAAVPRPAERVPPDEHGDGGDALRARARRGRADGLRGRLRPLLRDGHDRADACAAPRAPSGASRSRRSRSPARSRTRR